MFTINKNQDVNKDDDLNKLRKLYLKTIAKGEYENYINLVQTKSIKGNYLLEQALVYGRYKILQHMLNEENYKEYLNTIYDPFLLECCDPNITKDVYNGSSWSNDEHEKDLMNKEDIDHKKCFEILKEYNKKLKPENFLKWINIACNQIKYSGGFYFASYKLLFDELFDNNYNIDDIVYLLQELFPAKFILKVICEIFPPDLIIKKIIV
jgi:hypothetical protein